MKKLKNLLVLKIFLAISLLIFIAKFIFIANTMVVDDEAYYWFWGQNLALGYVEHGPFVAYFVRFFSFLFGDTGFGVRIGGVLTYGLLSVFLYYFVKDLASKMHWQNNSSSQQALPLIACTLFMLVPFYFIFAIVLTTDTPMMLFLFLGVSYYYKGFFHHKKYWYVGGVLLGIAMLAKIASLFVVVGICSYVVISRHRLQWLTKKELWISFLLIALFFSPQVIWNFQNNFAFLEYANFVLNKQVVPIDIVVLWASQFALYGPIFVSVGLCMLVGALFSYAKAKKNDTTVVLVDSLNEHKFYFAMISTVSLCYLIYTTFLNKIEVSWTAFAFVGIFYLVVLYFGSHWQKLWVRLLFYVQQIIALVMIIVLLLQTVENGILPLSHSIDITTRYYHYSFLKDDFKEYYESEMKQDYHILGSSYQVPSMINLYLKPEKKAICISRGNYHETMYSFEYTDDQLIGKNFYVMLLSKHDKLLRCFENVKELKSFTPKRNGKEIKGRTYYLYEAIGYRGRENFKP